MRIGAVVGLALIVAAAGALTGFASISNNNNQSPGPLGGVPVGGGQGAAAGLAGKVDPGIVDVYTFLGFQGGAAAGTGMVLTPSGEVLTNNHVIEGATSVKVTDLGNGETYTATVVGTDKTNDVALLQINGASNLKTVELGDSSKLAIGNAVTAIGNAGGAGGTPTVTTGNVTALDQAIVASDEVDASQEHLSGLVQTDAALQPGDSGGPLIDNQARVVAIDTAASANYQFQSGGSASYAIPIDLAASIARQIQGGQSSATVHIGPTALLGVRVEASGGLPGALVAGVQSKTPADTAGIAGGDLITSLGGQNVDSPTTLSNLMQSHHPGDAVKVGWIDTSGRQHSATVHLITGPAG